MMMNSLTCRVGDTPLVRLRRLEADCPGVELHAKLEYFNPGGSVKDRAAYQMVKEAMAAGRLGPGTTLIDSTSGNTGVAYSWLGAALGFKVALVMPFNVSAARKQIARAYGAEIIYSDPLEGSDGALRQVRELVAANPDRYFYPDQYTNDANPRAHELGTAQEIWAQTQGRVTDFVAGMGTSGTIMGGGRGLKALNPAIRTHGVEPAEPFHGLEGLKHMESSIQPGIYHPEELDARLPIATDLGWELSERCYTEEGLRIGHSGGAALAGALVVARERAARGARGVVVTVLPDRADRYFEPSRFEEPFAW